MGGRPGRLTDGWPGFGCHGFWLRNPCRSVGWVSGIGPRTMRGSDGTDPNGSETMPTYDDDSHAKAMRPFRKSTVSTAPRRKSSPSRPSMPIVGGR